jgi:hypothetical protein
MRNVFGFCLVLVLVGCGVTNVEKAKVITMSYSLSSMQSDDAQRLKNENDGVTRYITVVSKTGEVVDCIAIKGRVVVSNAELICWMDNGILKEIKADPLHTFFLSNQPTAKNEKIDVEESATTPAPAAKPAPNPHATPPAPAPAPAKTK